jgi:hypothetical protein
LDLPLFAYFHQRRLYDEYEWNNYFHWINEFSLNEVVTVSNTSDLWIYFHTGQIRNWKLKNSFIEKLFHWKTVSLRNCFIEKLFHWETVLLLKQLKKLFCWKDISIKFLSIKKHSIKNRVLERFPGQTNLTIRLILLNTRR